VDRLEPDAVAVGRILGREPPAQPLLATTRFHFDIDIVALGEVLGIDPAAPPDAGCGAAQAAASLSTAIQGVFLRELPGRAITFNESEGVFETSAPEMNLDFVVGKQIEKLPITPGTSLSTKLMLEVRNDTDEIRAVMSGDLQVVGRGRNTGSSAVVNPGFPLAVLRPGEFLRITGLEIGEGSPDEHARFAHVPRAGGNPVGVPEFSPDLVMAGAQVKASEEEARRALAELAEESYVPDELAEKLRARAEGGDVSELVVSEPDGPLVSLADVSKFRAPADRHATAWRVTAWAAAVPAGTGICRQLAQRAVRHLSDQLRLFLGAVAEDSIPLSSAEDKGRILLKAQTNEFTVTIGELLRVFGRNPHVTIDVRQLEHVGAMQITVDAPGGKTEALAALRGSAELALLGTDALVEALKHTRERDATDEERTTPLNPSV